MTVHHHREGSDDVHGVHGTREVAATGLWSPRSSAHCIPAAHFTGEDTEAQGGSQEAEWDLKDALGPVCALEYHMVAGPPP